MTQTKVLHIITSLHADGAQNMLLKLAQARDCNSFDYQVVSLLDRGVLGPELEKSGVVIHCLNMKTIKGLLSTISHLKTIIKNFEPDVIQSWMYHANLLALAAVKTLSLTKRPKLIWNIRRDLDSFEHDKTLTRFAIKLNARFSNKPEKIIYCGEKVKKDHLAIGFVGENKVLIANGFDCDNFYPSDERKTKLKNELKIPLSLKLVGMVGRFHSQKNHENFVKMAALVLNEQPETHFVLIGQGCNLENQKLMQWINNTPFPKQFHLLGSRRDVAEILPGIDIFCLSSSAEGFPNVLGEAMASGVICISTDAGAAREIIEDDQRISPINNPSDLAKKVLNVINLPEPERLKIQNSSRERILENFQISSISNKYQDLYEYISC